MGVEQQQENTDYAGIKRKWDWEGGSVDKCFLFNHEDKLSEHSPNTGCGGLSCNHSISGERQKQVNSRGSLAANPAGTSSRSMRK